MTPTEFRSALARKEMDMTTQDRRNIEKAMRGQFKVWSGTPNSEQILVDTCHALANAMKLNAMGRTIFLTECRGE